MRKPASCLYASVKKRRYLSTQVKRDLKRKMVFIAGPRQVGKTTIDRSLPGTKTGYLNWDVAEHRERILRRLCVIEISCLARLLWPDNHHIPAKIR